MFTVVYGVGGSLTPDTFQMMCASVLHLSQIYFKDYIVENYRQVKIIVDAICSLYSNRSVVDFEFSQ